MNDLQKRTWAEIHLGRLADNYHALRALAPESKFVGLVKANAYGHGAVPVAQKLTGRTIWRWPAWMRHWSCAGQGSRRLF